MIPTFRPVPNDGAGGGSAAEAELSSADLVLAEKLRDELIHRTHSSAGARVDVLAGWVGVSERKVRTLVTNLRERGWPICGTPESGYFWPSHRYEAEATLKYLNARLRTTEAVRDGIRQGLDMVFGELDESGEQMEMEL